MHYNRGIILNVHRELHKHYLCTQPLHSCLSPVEIVKVRHICLAELAGARQSTMEHKTAGGAGAANA